MNNLLNDICNRKKKEIEALKLKCSLKSLQKLIGNKQNREFKKILKESQKNEKNNIIAEIKQSSPSAGEIIKDYYPEDIAVKYEKAGAGAISILTEKNFFKGNIDHLSLINSKNFEYSFFARDKSTVLLKPTTPPYALFLCEGVNIC